MNLRVATSVNELDIVWKYRETCIFCETVLHYLNECKHSFLHVQISRSLTTVQLQGRRKNPSVNLITSLCTCIWKKSFWLYLGPLPHELYINQHIFHMINFFCWSNLLATKSGVSQLVVMGHVSHIDYWQNTCFLSSPQSIIQEIHNVVSKEIQINFIHQFPHIESTPEL